MGGGFLFTGAIVLNPFFAAFNPAEYAKRGPVRLLPVELTLVNDLPVNTRPERARVWFGVQRRFQIYFLDDNAYAREDLYFWTRGRSRAEILVKNVSRARPRVDPTGRPLAHDRHRGARLVEDPRLAEGGRSPGSHRAAR